MNLIVLIAKGHTLRLVTSVLLCCLSAGVSVGVISFIQHHFIMMEGELSRSLLDFLLLLALLFVVSTVAQTTLFILGHQFVLNKRQELVARLLNTDILQLEKLGKSAVLAALNTDVRNITLAFVRLPELIYGFILLFVALIYLAFLSLDLFIISLLFLTLTGCICYSLILRTNRHISGVREYDDALFTDYQSLIDGRKELALNPQRAARFFTDDFVVNAQSYCQHIIKADIHNSLAANLANTAVLAIIGINFYLAIYAHWATVETASIFALVILFLRAPLMAAVGALPTLLTANVSINKLAALNLNLDDKPQGFEVDTPHFQTLQLNNVIFQHRAAEGDAQFTVGSINLTLNRGELIFIVGGNGSGKTTLSHLITGLYQPQHGEVLLNGQPIDKHQSVLTRTLFSAVFNDFHLFHQVLNEAGEAPSDARIDIWLQQFEMADKVSHSQGRLNRVTFSQGQRKRLALLMAVLEQRPCLLLDEWAADQDPHFRALFYQQILPQLQRDGKTIIAITHDDKYFDAADRIFKMEEGKLMELDLCRDLGANNASISINNHELAAVPFNLSS